MSETLTCQRCASQRVVCEALAATESKCRCENCGREWLIIVRFIEKRRGQPDRRRATRGDRRKTTSN